MRAVRRRGIDTPWTKEFVGATVLQLVATAVAYCTYGIFVEARYLAIPLAIYTAFVVPMLICWAYCVCVDPSTDEGALRCKRMSATQNQVRFCRSCGKTIPGLDHHCNWLNTCIGTRNYVPFLVLVAAASAQHVAGVIFGICTPAAWRDTESSAAGPIALGVISAFISAVAAVSFGSLLSFHIFLLRKGHGTFDWMVQSALQRAEDEKAERAAAAAATAAAAAVPATAAPVAGAGAATDLAPTQAASLVAGSAHTAHAPAVASAVAPDGQASAPSSATDRHMQSGSSAGAGAGTVLQVADNFAHPVVAAAVQSGAPAAASDAQGAAQSQVQVRVVTPEATSDGKALSPSERARLEEEEEGRAGLRALAAMRAQFRSSNPANDVSLFMAAPAVTLPQHLGYGAGWASAEDAEDAQAAAAAALALSADNAQAAFAASLAVATGDDEDHMGHMGHDLASSQFHGHEHGHGVGHGHEHHGAAAGTTGPEHEHEHERGRGQEQLSAGREWLGLIAQASVSQSPVPSASASADAGSVASSGAEEATTAAAAASSEGPSGAAAATGAGAAGAAGAAGEAPRAFDRAYYEAKEAGDA